jgi:hypothetical protein
MHLGCLYRVILTTMSSAVQTLTQVKARTGIMAVVVYTVQGTAAAKLTVSSASWSILA